MWAETENISKIGKRYILRENQDIPLVRSSPGAISGDVMVHRWLVITLLTRNLHKNIPTENFLFMFENQFNNKLLRSCNHMLYF